MNKHTRREDWIAILTGTLIVAQGIFFLQTSGLLTGGTTGLALLISQVVPFSFGVIYFLCNTPFYLLAWKRFGAKFALNSAISGALVSIFTDHLYLVITVDKVDPLYCAIAGGLLMGLGMLILFRHRSSLGGFNVLCLFIQDKFGISVGKTQLAIDFSILTMSFFFVSPLILAYSVVGAFILNVVLGMNHKPSRYIVKYS
ncbi:YitT family protein [Vibrio taketomensis]|uniref:YitT family protein n=1 Tax=Vibrio taketomensis TaxID=2572923 RepID=UPI0013895DAC|nr:YitT family protein [Vibrio taketomensis]